MAAEKADRLERRLARHGRVAAALEGLDDGALRDLVDAAPVTGAGIGGAASVIEVAGVTVFAKRVALTDREREPENVGSTANLFRLPASCHWGVGSPGLGAWRELAAHTMTTAWVLDGDAACFPLLHHWRVVEAAPTPVHDELADIDAVIAFWDGAPEVGDRIEGLAAASAALVLFLEHLPANLIDWLDAQHAAGAETCAAAIAMVDRELRPAIAAMNARGLVHFDGHLRNLLTDGERIFITDFGLAASPDFDLDAPEADLVEATATHDEAYAATRFVNWLVTAHLPGLAADPLARNRLIDRVARGDDAGDELSRLPDRAAAIVVRDAPVAAVVNEFYFTLHTASRTIAYPAAAVARARQRTGW